MDALDLSLLGNILVGNTTASIPSINLDQPTLSIINFSGSNFFYLFGRVRQAGPDDLIFVHPGTELIGADNAVFGTTCGYATEVATGPLFIWFWSGS